jgi:hypothetical protein
MAEQSAKNTPFFNHYTLPDGKLFIYVNNLNIVKKGEKLWFSNDSKKPERFYLNYKGENESLNEKEKRIEFSKKLLKFLNLDPNNVTWDDLVKATEKK